MADYPVNWIYPGDAHAMGQLDALLEKEGIRRDRNLDRTLGLFDENRTLIATGSSFGNTLRCLAVDSAHRGEGLMSKIVSELVSDQWRRGHTHLFLYTKCEWAHLFQDLGFYEIVRVDNRIVFMENRSAGFSDYLDGLKNETAAACREGGLQGAVIMNANPFTLGHLHLLEQAAAACRLLHVFLVSEDVSLVPFAVRKQLVEAGSAGIRNLVFHYTGSYLISSATFPSYFLKDSADVIASHAKLDVAIFIRIAHALGITHRFVGEEPFSQVTAIYNRIMEEGLVSAGIDFTVIPRKAAQGQPISASQVRLCLKEGNYDQLRQLVPETTFRYFTSPEAAPVLEKIRSSSQIIHY